MSSYILMLLNVVKSKKTPLQNALFSCSETKSKKIININYMRLNQGDESKTSFLARNISTEFPKEENNK